MSGFNVPTLPKAKPVFYLVKRSVCTLAA